VKKILVIVFIVGMAGCKGKPDFTSIKKGMKSADVVSMVGVPLRRQTMGEAQWWLYNDSGQHLVVIEHDTVANCMTQKEAMQIMSDALKKFDSLNKK
jgi:hypothetical protein